MYLLKNKLTGFTQKAELEDGFFVLADGSQIPTLSSLDEYGMPMTKVWDVLHLSDEVPVQPNEEEQPGDAVDAGEVKKKDSDSSDNE